MHFLPYLRLFSSALGSTSPVLQPMPQFINEQSECWQNDYMPRTANAVIHKDPLLLPAARWEAAPEKENSSALPANL